LRPHRKWLYTLLYAAIAIYVYALFRPIFVWSYGWSKLPITEAPITSEIISSEYKDEIELAREALAEVYSELQSPAVSVAVGKDGEIIWREAIGFADLEELLPVSLNSQFRIGSTSKAVTSAVVGRLIDSGKIDLDRSIDHYIEYYGPGNKITVRQLMTHTAGIRNYGLCLCLPIWEYYNTKRYDSVTDAVEVFADSPLLFDPGSQFSYSSYGYTLLSGVMEAAAQLKTELFTPLKMRSTLADQFAHDSINLVKFYDIKDRRYKKVFHVDNSNKLAGGGFVSTPSDLVRLGNALLTENYLTQSTLESLFMPQILNNGDVNPQRYALGWRSGLSGDLTDRVKNRNLRVLHHGGVAIGGLSFLLLIPELNLVISIVANKSLNGEFPLGEYAMRIAIPFT